MPTPSAIARLTDIVGAVELIRGELVGMTLQSLESDKRDRPQPNSRFEAS
jgi:hypothetical protein